MMRALLVAGALAILLTMPCLAQPDTSGPPDRPFERIERLRRVRLIETLDLSEDQSIRFFARMNEHEKARHALRAEKNDLLDRLDRLIRNHADSTDLTQLFPQVLSVDQRMAEENRKFFYGVRDILTAEQQGKLLLFERHFDNELREAMREVQRHRRGLDSGPPPGQ